MRKGISVETTAFLVSIAEASQALRVSRNLLYGLINQKRIPFYRLSPRTIRLDISELRDHMKSIAQEAALLGRGENTSVRGRRRRRQLEPKDKS